jgi:general secretion pathway protein M
MLWTAALVAIMGLVYVLLIDPALAGRNQLNKDLPLMRQQVAQLQALSKEAAALSGKTIVPPATLSKEDIESALMRNGLKAKSVILTGSFVKVQLEAASFASTLIWLDDMQKTALITVAEANIVTASRPDTVNATLTLRQPSHD